MYWEQNAASSEYADKVLQRIDEMEKELSVREAAWKKDLRRSKSPGFGVFAGPAYTSEGSFGVVAGVGIVWKW